MASELKKFVQRKNAHALAKYAGIPWSRAKRACVRRHTKTVSVPCRLLTGICPNEIPTQDEFWPTNIEQWCLGTVDVTIGFRATLFKVHLYDQFNCPHVLYFQMSRTSFTTSVDDPLVPITFGEANGPGTVIYDADIFFDPVTKITDWGNNLVLTTTSEIGKTSGTYTLSSFLFNPSCIQNPIEITRQHG